MNDITVKKPVLPLLMFAATLPLILLWIWREVYWLGCVALIIPFLMWLILTIGIREAAILRRQAMYKCYFRYDSRLRKWVNRYLITTIYVAVLSLVLTLIALFAVLTWGRNEALLLILNALLLALIYHAITTRLNAWGVQKKIIPVLAKRWSVALSVPLVLMALLWLQLNSAPPAYLDTKSLSQSMQNAAMTVESDCRWVNTLAKLQLEKEAIGWWLMIRGGQLIQNHQLKWLAWLLFLISGGIVWWAVSRLAIEGVHFAYYYHQASADSDKDESR